MSEPTGINQELLTAAQLGRAALAMLAMAVVMGQSITSAMEAKVNAAQDALNAACQRAEAEKGRA